MLVKIISLFDQNNTFPFMFKVEGLWVMVFWQRTQRQNVLMIFPYGLQKKKKKGIPLCLLLTMTTKTNKAAFVFLAVLFLRIFCKGILLLWRKACSFLQANFSETLGTIQILILFFLQKFEWWSKIGLRNLNNKLKLQIALNLLF